MKRAIAFVLSAAVSSGAYAVDCDPVQAVAPAPVAKSVQVNRAAPVVKAKRVVRAKAKAPVKRTYKAKPASVASIVQKPRVECAPVARSTILATMLKPIVEQPSLFQPTPMEQLFAVPEPAFFDPLLVQPVMPKSVGAQLTNMTYWSISQPVYGPGPMQYVPHPLVPVPEFPSYVPAPGSLLLAVAGFVCVFGFSRRANNA